MLIKRRSVLRGLAGMACSPLFLHSLAAEAAGSNLIVVVVQMSGGNDGLNTVIPLGSYGRYSLLRGGTGNLAYSLSSLSPTAFDPSYSTPASSAGTFAFAPTMGAMRALYATGKLAVITGIGLPWAEQAALSHSNARQDWATGYININPDNAPNGWLGATLADGGFGVLGGTASTSGVNELTVVDGLPGLVAGNNPAGFKLYVPNNAPDATQMGIALGGVDAIPTTTPVAAASLSLTDATLSAQSYMETYGNLATDYPSTNSYLGSQLKAVAQMIVGNSGIRGFATYADGSYDTHSGQNQAQPQQLGSLSNALQQFYSYLVGKGASSNVVVATISDFGRTPHVNDNDGTDHGAASVAFVLGDPVKGGVYGTYPSLSTFNPNGNLTVNVDFRNMLSDIIHAMGGNPATVLNLPTAYPKLGFI